MAKELDLRPAKKGIALDDNQKLQWLQLIRSENVGPATFRDLINHFGSAGNALDALPELSRRGNAGRTIRICSLDEAAQEFERISNFGAFLLGVGEPEYPFAMRSMDTPPPLLTVIGSRDVLTQPAIGVVGSRNASLSGIKFTKALTGPIGEAGYAIVSGLARGIDTAAHEASLRSGTIACFAGGIDHLYPPENGDLMKAIVDNNGAAISEMPFSYKPRAQDFPRRNRLIAGASLGLLVVEAAQRSGSLISARLANEMGRLVFAVPGSPLDPRSAGTNRLLKQGAIIATEAADIIDAVNPLVGKIETAAPFEEPDEAPFDPMMAVAASDRDRVISALGPTPTDVDEIIRFTELPAPMIQLVLIELDIAGRLERHTSNRVSLV